GNRQTGVAQTKLPEKLERLWTFKAGDSNAMVASTAAIVGDQVYVGSLTGEFICLNRRTGEKIWGYRSKVPANPNDFIPGFKTSPTVTADTVYAGDEDGVFHAIDRASGKERWKFEAAGEISNGITVHEDKVLFGSHDYNLYCLKASDGTKVWSYA